jgi:UMF1 family MFS transporter
MRYEKTIWGWAIYDWANSAFATTVMAGFFPIFFKQFWSYGADVNLSTAKLGFGNSIASLLVALMAPILGAIADQGSVKKRFLLFFAYLGALMTAALFFVPKGHWAPAITFYAVGIIGFSGANIFYDALLPTVAKEEDIDFVSGFGFSLGYLGGGLLFLLNVLMTLMPEKFGLTDPAVAVRTAFLSVAIWWGFFTLFTLWWVPESRHSSSIRKGRGMVREGLRQLRGTFHKVRHLKVVFLFLVAYWFYIDGVDTIIRMAVDYGLSLGFASNDLIVALLITQFIQPAPHLLLRMDFLDAHRTRFRSWLQHPWRRDAIHEGAQTVIIKYGSEFRHENAVSACLLAHGQFITEIAHDCLSQTWQTEMLS